MPALQRPALRVLTTSWVLGSIYVSRHFLKRSVVITAALLVGSSSLAGVTASIATTTTPATAIGFDISFPQCSRTYPVTPGFGIVGVNNGRDFTTNPCLASQLKWAQGATNSAPGFYVNTGNPGPVNTASWPTNQSSPKPCSGANSTTCSYDYGWSAAHYSMTAAIAAEATNGSSPPGTAASSAPWWLDVETANPWEARMSNYGPTASSHANDQAVLEGMIGYLTSAGVTTIGIYTASRMWSSIMGPSVTVFSSIPLWIPGPGTLSTAQSQCSVPSFIGGRVAMVQYPSQGFDGDVKCGLVTTPATYSVSVNGSAIVNDQIVVTNNAGTVTFTQLTGAPSLVVSTSGVVTTSGQLAAGTYRATGTAIDSHGNADAFSFTLNVGVLTQTSPTTGRVKVSGSAKYSVQLALTSNTSALTFTQSTGTPTLLVSSTGLVTTSGPLSAGVYSATGTVVDASGDAGYFNFSLRVGSLVQRAPHAMTIESGASATFSQQLDVGANLGPVSYVQTSGQSRLLVSSTGLITSVGALTKGVDVVTGTTSDTTGDVGTFTFALTVTTTGTTTTTSTTTTTTTTTVPLANPIGRRVIGHASAGRSSGITIVGSGFYGRPTITSHHGTAVIVTRDTGNRLDAIVIVSLRSRKGTFTFTLRFARGEHCQVRYIQR
jgi:hypothetical protein